MPPRLLLRVHSIDSSKSCVDCNKLYQICIIRKIKKGAGKENITQLDLKDALNMASFGNQLLIKYKSELYNNVQSTLKPRLEQEKIILLSK